MKVLLSFDTTKIFPEHVRLAFDFYFRGDVPEREAARMAGLSQDEWHKHLSLLFLAALMERSRDPAAADQAPRAQLTVLDGFPLPVSEDLHREACQVAITMRRYGGSFVQSLGETVHRADPEHQATLRAAFPELWAKYKQMAELQQPQQAAGVAGR